MKKVFSVILSICFTILLFGTLLLGVVGSNVNAKSISKLLTDVLKSGSISSVKVPDNGLYYPDAGKQVVLTDFDLSSIDVSDLSSLDINQIIKDISKEYDVTITDEIIEDIVTSPEAVDFLSKYTEEIIDYVTGKDTEFNVEAEDVKKLVNNSITIYEKATGEVIDRTGLDENIEVGVKEASVSITQGLDEAKEEMSEDLETLQKVNELLEFKTFIKAIIICVVVALLILLLNLKTIGSFLKCISIPALIDGLLILISGLIVTFSISVISSLLQEMLPVSIVMVVLNYIHAIVMDLIKTGAVTFAVSIVLLILGIQFNKKLKQSTEVAEDTE